MTVTYIGYSYHAATIVVAYQTLEDYKRNFLKKIVETNRFIKQQIYHTQDT